MEAFLGPARNLVVNNVNFLVLLLAHAHDLLLFSDLSFHLNDLLILELVLWSSIGVVDSLSVDLQLMELGSQLIIISLKLLDLSLRVVDINEQMRVGLFTGKELLYHLLNISDTGLGLNSLESIVNLLTGSHFVLHLLSEEDIPEFLDEQVLSHLELRGILILVGSSLSNLLVPPLSLNSLLDTGLLKSDASLQLMDNLLSIPLLLLDVLHQVEEDGSTLESLLLDLSLLLVLQLEDLLLVLKSSLVGRSGNLGSNEVLLHSLEHVLVALLSEVFLLNLILGLLFRFLKHLNSLAKLMSWSLNIQLLVVDLLDLFSLLLQLLLLLVSQFLGLIKLSLDLLKLSRHLAKLFSLVLVRSRVVSWFKESGSLDMLAGTVIDFVFLLHDGAGNH